MARAEIRTAEPADAPAISELIEKLVRRYVLKDCTPDGRRALLASIAPDALQAALARGVQYHLAASGGDLFGVVAMRDASHLQHLFVVDSVRGTGLGRRLWETARDDVCMHGTAPPVFTVNSSLHAVGFFRALGFQPTGPDEERDGMRIQPMRYVMLGSAPR
jgi:GNAT superfamily N-acetyltransferase